MASSSRVLIIGAGVAGLSLAQGLRKAKIPFHVFEKDSNSDYRAQGYRIRVSSEGVSALRHNLSCELWDRFETSCAVAVEGGTEFDAMTGQVTGRRTGAPPWHKGGRPYTVDRTVLRALLLTGLDEHISFGQSFQSFTQTPHGVTAHFSNGSNEEGSMLVGADGLRSPVRKQYIPNLKMLDTRGRCVFGKTIIDQDHLGPFLESARGLTLIIDTRSSSTACLFLELIRFQKNFPGQHPPPNYIYWVFVSQIDALGMPDEQFLKLSGADAAQHTLTLTADWDSAFQEVLQMQDVSQTSPLRISTTDPEIPHWEPSRVTLIRDAAHPMPPTGGIGANTALKDTKILVEALQKDVSAESVGDYEQQMKVYAAEAINFSFSGARRMFSMLPVDQLKAFEV